MSLKDDLNKIGEVLAEGLAKLQAEYEGFETNTVAEQEELLKRQADEAEKLRADLSERDAKLHAEAEKASNAAIEAADKIIAAAFEKDKATQDKKIEAAGDGNNDNGNKRDVNVR